MRQAWHWLVRKLIGRWVRVTIKPDDAAALLAARPRPVCYVLERESQTDLAVLGMVCAKLGLPTPENACFELGARTPRHLVQLVAAAAADPKNDVDFVPVAIFWGRAPRKEVSLWRLLFAEDWVLVGRFRKFLAVLVNGRNTLMHFGEPLRLRDAMQEGMSEERSVRWVLRHLRTGLRAQRASTIGPDLSHRRTLVTQLLKTADVRAAVRREMQVRGLTRRAALLAARKHALEIAANYSESFIRFMSAVLGWLWNRLYDGVDFEHVEALNEIGDGAEIIFVPCHRSHMDYLLLSYVIYHKGFAAPHVAGGVNLNLPVIGRFLRKGGAFFLRRTFKGDALYAVVFAKYLGFMMARGHTLEYFIEGGRSRTGRLLSPRTGMLSMTLHAYLKDPKRPVVFMPVYFGYERIVEGRTYIGELSGQPKEKESVFGLIKATLSVLRSKLGRVHVNLGRPIALDELLSRHNPDWRRSDIADAESPAGWLNDAVCGSGDADQRRNQRGRRGDADQSGGDGDSRHAAPGAGRKRPSAAGRAVSAAAARCALRAFGDRDHRQRRANDRLRRSVRNPGAAEAPARRHHAHECRKCRAGHLLPQQHPAFVRHALAARLLLREQCRHAYHGHSSHGVAGLPLHFCRALSALGRDRRARCGRRIARHVRPARICCGRTRTAASGGDRPRPRSKPYGCRCWRRRPSRRWSGTTWPSHCCCNRAAAASRRKRSSSAAT